MMAILCQVICGVLLLSFLSGSHAVPAHAQRARRSSDGWSDCSVECGGGTRVRVETHVDCNVFGCDFQPSCSCGEADILFIVDHSGSIGERNYWQQKQFMVDLMTGLNRVGDDSTRTSRVGVVSFGHNETVEFDFNDGYSVGGLSAVVDKIWQMPYRDGLTNTASALAKAAEIFDTQGRLGPKRIAILLTDGASTVNPEQTIPSADDLKDTGAFLYAIGIGQVDVTELRAIASEPSDLFYFYAADYQHLDTIIEEVLNGSCCYSTDTNCVTSKDDDCSLLCGGGERTTTETCTYTNYFGEVIKVVETPGSEPCCTESCTSTSGPGVDDCARCDYTSGIGFIPDEANCQCYYQCQPVADSFLIHHMCCAAGLFWADSIKTCGWQPEGVCTMPGARVKRAVEEGCQSTSPVVPSSTPATPVTYPCPYTTNPSNPAQFLFNGALMGTCPSGLVWDVVKCACDGTAVPAVCSDDILLHFPFDDHLDDVSCNKAKSDIHGVVQLKSTSGRKGGAAYFRGTDFLSVQFLNNWFAWKDVRAWTMALWINPSGSSGFAGLVNNGDCEDEPSVSVFQAATGSASALVDTDTATQTKLINYAIPSNQWSHVAMVYSGWQLTFYVNGARQGSSRSVSGPIENRHCPLNIGRQSVGGVTATGYFTGYMDEIRIYDKVLYDYDIQQLYQNP